MMCSVPIARVALAVVSLVVLGGCPQNRERVEPAQPAEPAVKATAPDQVLAEVDPAKGLQYFATRGGNHPTIYLDRAAGQFVIASRTRSLGGSTRAVATIDAAKVDDALAAYHRQLVALGYQPHDAPPKPASDPNALVAVPMEDLFGAGGPDRATFPSDQAEVLYRTAPTQGWKILSGSAHPTHDFPVMAAYGQGLVVVGPGAEEEFPWSRSRDAFAAYKKIAAQPPRK